MAVVGQTDERGRVREAQVRALQRQDDRVDDWVSDDRDHHDCGGTDEHPGEATLAPGTPGEVMAPRWGSGCGLVGGGHAAHSSAPEDRAFLISSRSAVTTLVGLIDEVGERAFWIASETSA